MDQDAHTSFDTSADAAARVSAIRRRLPGQLVRDRVDSAAILYGPLYSLAEVRSRIAESLPRKIGFVRAAVLEPIDQYRGPIPDDALLKYDDAVQTGFFGKFFVATPTYCSDRQVDPWIVAEVQGTDRWAIIARWD